MTKLVWTENEYQSLVASAPAKDYNGVGKFIFIADKRQSYCDRGSWLVHVDQEVVNGLDDQEGFPRYYFDTENMKEEIQLWVNKRQECNDANT